ncbi:MAG: DUF6576 domain-containing protein [Gemmataceae bacterium]
MSWSFPIGRMFGINVRVHVILPLVMLGLILRVTSKDFGVPLADAAIVMALMFGSILLHEFGHCFAARSVDGDASEVLLWPLGGLAYCDLPHTAKAHLICALGGPAVNVLLCVFAAGALAFAGLRPSLNPIEPQYIPTAIDWRHDTVVKGYRGVEFEPTTKPRELSDRPDVTSVSPSIVARPAPAATVAAPGLLLWQGLAVQLFWVNWLGLILTMLPGFPLDGGRVLQAILWMKSDYRQAMATASYAGFIVMLILGVYSIAAESVLALALAYFVYVSCKQQLILLETGGEDSPFGYDFSQGYTSLEGESAPVTPPKRKRPNVFQRWLQKRAAKRAAREIEQRESDERRMDELLEKVQREGLPSLSEEERRFLTRVSARYRGNKS